MNVLGPIIGGPFPEGDHISLAVSKVYFDQICSQRTVIRPDDVHPLNGDGVPAPVITATWIDYVSKINDPCIEVAKDAGLVYHVL